VRGAYRLTFPAVFPDRTAHAFGQHRHRDRRDRLRVHRQLNTATISDLPPLSVIELVDDADLPGFDALAP